MAEEAQKVIDEPTIEVSPELPADQAPSEAAPLVPTDEEPDGSTIPEKFDVVLDGDAGAQQKTVPLPTFYKRMRKLNQKTETAVAGQTQAEAALVHEKNKNAVLEMALEQEKSRVTSQMPNPNDFDDGANDAKYVHALNEHNQAAIQAGIEKAIATQPAPAAPVVGQDPDIERLQSAHYTKAAKLGIEDFGEVEDVALDIMGQESVNWIIANTENSELLLYYLGKNPDQAHEIADLARRNSGKAVLKLGRLDGRVKTRPKANANPASDPDDELPGGTPSAAAANVFQRKLDKLREKVAVSGDSEIMGQILTLKKQAREKGVAVS